MGAAMGATQREYARRHVIVVEDDAAICEMITTVLSEEGYLVTAFTRIDHDTFSAIQALQPDVVMCDLRLPGDLSCDQLLDLIVDDPVLRDTPLIICSADRALSAASARLGHTRMWLLDKPFMVDDLIDTVTVALDDDLSAEGAPSEQTEPAR
jgi:CheY-like chemotaxis protein